MVEPVLIDVWIMVRARNEEAPVQLPDVLKTKLTATVERVLQQARGQAEVSKNDLNAALVADLNPEPFTLVATDAVMLNAEYKETGLQLKNTDTVSLAGHQEPQKNRVEIELQTPLDGQS